MQCRSILKTGSSPFRRGAAAGAIPLFDQYPLKTDGKPMGSYVDASGNLVGFAQTPGYETYKGLGWYGVVTQKRTA